MRDTDGRPEPFIRPGPPLLSGRRPYGYGLPGGVIGSTAFFAS